MIIYKASADDLAPENLTGFFVGWPHPPAPETLLKILRQSYEIVLAVDDDSGNVIGFINAISDGVLSAYIPLLEVLPEYQGRGIGRELVGRMIRRLDKLYMIDLVCDERLFSFYEKMGMKRGCAMMIRSYKNQSAKSR